MSEKKEEGQEKKKEVRRKQRIHFSGTERFVCFFSVLWLEHRVSCLLVRHSTTWATPPALICVGYF
jgi:hypothetical protein